VSKRAFFAVLLALSAGWASPARADYLGSHLFSGQVNQLSDDSLERVVVAPGNSTTVLQSGDIIQGTLTFHALQLPGVQGSQVSLGLGSPVQVTAYYSLVVNIAKGSNVATLTPDASFVGKYGAGAMIVLFENTTQSYNALTKGTFAEYTNAAQSGLKLATFGFTGSGGSATGGEGANLLLNSMNLGSGSSQSTLGFLQGNLNLVNGGAGVAANGLSNDFGFTASQGSTFGDGSSTQLGLQGSLFNRSSGSIDGTDSGRGNPFPLGGNTSVFFEPYVLGAPEPQSYLLLGLGFVAFVAVSARKRLAAL
jgi:hypothetical protein